MQLQHCVFCICMKGNLEYSNKVYVCHVDDETAFDRADWSKVKLQTNDDT